MKRYFFLMLICVCFVCVGCAGNITATDTGGESAILNPVTTPARAPEAPAPLTPKLLMDTFIAKHDPQHDGWHGFFVRSIDIADVLESYGETQFFAYLRRLAGANDYLNISDEALLYESTYVSGSEDIPFAVILLNDHRRGYGMVMENRGGWQFMGYFECGEVEVHPEEEYHYIPDPRVRTHSAKLLDDGSLQTWLQIPGHVDSGTGRAAYDCTWYNLNSGRVDVRYITENVQCYPPFCYSVTGEAKLANEFYSGGYPLEIDYSCRFGVAPEDYWSGEEQNDIVFSRTEYFLWSDGGLMPQTTYQTLYNQKEVQPGILMDSAWDQFHKLEKRGTSKEKEWASQIRELNYDAMSDHIILENIYNDRQEIGRRKGGLPPAEFEEMRELAPTIQTPGGAPVKLIFTDRPDMNYTLTKYEHDGSTAIVPIDNGMFNTQEQQGTIFYTLETTWFFGSYIYGFELCATEDGEKLPCLPAEEAAAIKRAREYLKEITGYDFIYASATAELWKWSEMDGSPDEWSIGLLLPHQNMTANVRFEQDGQMTFYALGALGKTDDPNPILPLLPQPTDTEDISYTEKAGFWYEKLPIKRMGETRVIEQAAKNRRGQYENSLETITKQRFTDGSVLTSHFDQETGRLTYFCMYPAKILKGN